MLLCIYPPICPYIAQHIYISVPIHLYMCVYVCMSNVLYLGNHDKIACKARVVDVYIRTLKPKKHGYVNQPAWNSKPSDGSGTTDTLTILGLYTIDSLHYVRVYVLCTYVYMYVRMFVCMIVCLHLHQS